MFIGPVRAKINIKRPGVALFFKKKIGHLIRSMQRQNNDAK